jgi:hypothetical protein
MDQRKDKMTHPRKMEHHTVMLDDNYRLVSLEASSCILELRGKTQKKIQKTVQKKKVKLCER